jgi:ABC-type Zn uptake system ZnuABC Zn-binding protein ZnuA
MTLTKLFATTITALAILALSTPATAQAPLAVCCTTIDLGALVGEIGGDQVAVTTFVKGPEDPHFIEAKPSFVKALAQADLFVLVGMDLEVGWVPVLLRSCRNAAVLPGAAGYVDASTAITPLGVPGAPIDRSMGDVHALGNPHYLADPLNGLKVADLIRRRLTDRRPDRKAYFDERFADFKQRVGRALVGEELAKKYDFEKLALLHEHGKLLAFLKEQGLEGALGGWLGRCAPAFGAQAVSDHDLWPYFAKRFGIVVAGFLEPRPGIPPTTRHLGEVVALMKSSGIRAIFSVPYFDAKHAHFVAKAAGAKVATMAHQTGARDGTPDYLAWVDYNVSQACAALMATPR